MRSPIAARGRRAGCCCLSLDPLSCCWPSQTACQSFAPAAGARRVTDHVTDTVDRILPRVDLMRSIHAANVALTGKKGSPTACQRSTRSAVYRRDGGAGGICRPGARCAHELAGGLRGARGECWAVNFAETPGFSINRFNRQSTVGQRGSAVWRRETSHVTTIAHEPGVVSIVAIYMAHPVNVHFTHDIPRRKREGECRTSLAFRGVAPVRSVYSNERCTGSTGFT